jgi:hypothetical protein
MATTQKQQLFVSQSMGMASIMAVPWIGNAIGGRLMASGFTMAKQLYGHYLLNLFNPQNFLNLIIAHGGNSWHANGAYQAMVEWDKSNN